VLRFDELLDPEIIEPTDAIIAPIAATTCDLDHLLIAGKAPFQGPFPLGHECVGKVVKVGVACQKYSIGDIVGLAWHIACGTCVQCHKNYPANCKPHWNSQYGLPAKGDWGGTFSDLVRVPYADYNLAKIPEGVDPIHVASIGDNLALGWESVMPSINGIEDPEIVIFGGSKSIGLYCVDVAANCANANTIYYDHNIERLEIAEKLGAEVRDQLPKRGSGDFNLAIDASGKAEMLRLALTSVEPEGQVNSVGIYFEDVALPMFQLYLRGVNFHNGKGHARPNMEPVLEAVSKGILHPELVTSGVYEWDEMPEVLSSGAARKPVFRRM